MKLGILQDSAHLLSDEAGNKYNYRNLDKREGQRNTGAVRKASWRRWPGPGSIGSIYAGGEEDEGVP